MSTEKCDSSCVAILYLFLSWIKHKWKYGPFMQGIHVCLSNYLYLCPSLGLFVILFLLHTKTFHISLTSSCCFVLWWHSLTRQSYLNERLDCGGKKQTFFFFSFHFSTRRSSSAPCSSWRDKQLTFSMTHSTLISTKYSTVPLFKAINLISEGISHLAIIFWTIKPISEE